MSSTKPEVHNMLHFCQRRTEPHPQVTCTENLVKFRRVVFRSTLRQSWPNKAGRRSQMSILTYLCTCVRSSVHKKFLRFQWHLACT